MMEIKIPLIDFKDTEILGGEPDLCILSDNYIEHKWKTHSRHTEELPHREVNYVGTTVYLKKFIIGVNAGYDTKTDRYDVRILTTNPAEELIYLFGTLKDALELKSKIQKWLLT